MKRRPNRTEQRKRTTKTKTDSKQAELIPEDVPEDILEEVEQRIDSSIPCKFDQIVYRDNVKGKPTVSDTLRLTNLIGEC